ncbi:MAG: hypothetical protein AVO33_00115 [delta proteobacterium ML8_F1]|nr:MAG: hypothetical protein AVO33_00115 [delta proteobacterium ML8_F1]
MNYTELLKIAGENALESVYLMVNREEYLCRHTLDALEKQLVPEGLETFNKGVFDLEEVPLTRVTGFLNTPVLMGGIKMAVVYHLDVLNPDEKALEDLLEAARGQLMLMVFSNKMSKVFKGLQKRQLPVVVFEKLDPPDFKKWVVKRFRLLGKKLTNQSLDFFIRYSDYNERDQRISLYQMENEIKKIASLDSPIIEIEDLRKMMVAPLEINIFALTDALAGGDGPKTLKILDDLFQRGHTAYEILPLLTKHYHNMVIAKALGEAGLPHKAQQEILGFKSDYPVKMIQKRIGALTKKRLLGALETCLNYELLAKQQKINPRVHLESLLVALMH